MASRVISKCRPMLAIAFVLTLILAACSDYKEDYQLCQVRVTLIYPDTLQGCPYTGAPITLKDSKGVVFTENSDTTGSALFNVPPGTYEAGSSDTHTTDIYKYVFNALKSGIVIQPEEANSILLSVNITKKEVIKPEEPEEDDKPGDKNFESIIIKELYTGGCRKDDGTSTFQHDKGVVIYNNSNKKAVVTNLCFATGNTNAYASNAAKNYNDEGVFVPDTYDTPFQPAWSMIWYLPEELTIQPYSQVVISINGAIDNTLTVSNSVNYANAEYYCMYDPDAGWTGEMSTSFYPTPADVIPASHYLKGKMYGVGSAWALQAASPAFFIFKLKDSTPLDFANDNGNDWYLPGYDNDIIELCKKVPQTDVIDAVEVFSAKYSTASQYKRLSANLDAGYVMLTNYQGHTVYRNVDKEATMKIEGNAEKLVYGYADDPSGIDAEASIKNGAKIVYLDTNNSTNDFHEREAFSIKQ